MSGSAIRAGSTITVAVAVVVSNWRLLTNKVKLAKEPQANVERYDALRQAREVRHAS